GGVAGGVFVRIVISSEGGAVAFVEASKRVDYVNGTSSSPVAFVEGVYVEPAARDRGVARALVSAVEDWAEAEGCAELASDSPLENLAAPPFPRAFGFGEDGA